jgi:hypothetical protein
MKGFINQPKMTQRLRTVIVLGASDTQHDEMIENISTAIRDAPAPPSTRVAPR